MARGEIDLCDIEDAAPAQSDTVGKFGDDRPPASAYYAVRVGMATGFVYEVLMDGITQFEVCEVSPTEARKVLRERWADNTKQPWPGHRMLRLQYVEVW